jgi:hypothetical protein
MRHRRYVASMILAALAVLVLATPVSADRRWCLSDPIVALNGTEVQILVGIPEEYLPLVNGPIDVQLRVPSGVTTEVVFLDEGFNGYGEVVTFHADERLTVNGGGVFPIEIAATVPIDPGLAGPLVVPAAPSAIPLQIVVIEGRQQRTFTGLNDGAWVTTRVKGERP